MAANPVPVDDSARMKRAKLSQDARNKEEDPAFLRPHKVQKRTDLHYSDVAERAEGSQVDVRSAVFRPNWGFRKQDSVVGSTVHSVDWSRNSLTSPDYRDFVVNGGIGESEALGCQALATVNAHFQGTLHRARSWERKAKEFETESQQRALQIKQLEDLLVEERERLEAAQAEVVALRANREAEKEKAIDDFLDSEDYRKLMDQHDDTLLPLQYNQGWEEALGAVLERHPGLFQLSDFPSPFALKVAATEATSYELFGEDDALVKEHAATTAAAGTSSKGKEVAVEGSEESTTQTSPSKAMAGGKEDAADEVTSKEV